MTRGPLFSRLVIFSLPIILTNLLQMLYNAADMMVVGLSAEENAVGAIGTTGAMISTMLTLFIGVSGGVTVVVSQRLGAKDDEATERAVHTAVAMALPFGLLAMAALMLLSGPILKLLGDTGDILRLATLYTRIYAVGFPFSSMVNFVFGIFNAKGDSRTPFFAMTFAGALNVVLNLFFVLALGMSVEGVAIATTISNAVCAAILVWRLKRSEGPCRLFFRKIAFHKKAMREILRNGIPNALQGTMFGISNMMILSSVMQVNNAVMATLPAETTYQPVVNGNAIAGNIEGFAYTVIHSVAQAVLPFAGQNAGAKEYRRAARVLLCGLLFAGSLATILGWGFILLRTPLFALYGLRFVAGTPEAIAYEVATLRLRVMLGIYVTAAMMEVGAGVMRGIGKAVTSAVTVFLLVCVLRIAWMLTVFRYYFAFHENAPLSSLASIYISYPISWALSGAILSIAAFLTLRKREKQKTEQQ